MSARGPFALLALLSIPLPACSAIVRELNVSCESDDDCDALNQAEKLEQSCITYQCRTDHKGCEKQPRDKDRDGVPDKRTCADERSGEKLDCDDDDDARAEGLKERCDGIDNDCDETIDEGALGPDSLRELESVSLGGVSSLAFADRVDGELLVATTRSEGSLQRSIMYRWPGSSSLLLQDPGQANCDDGRRCSLDPLAIAAQPSLVVAIGIERAGPSIGRLRFALRRDWRVSWEAPLMWDGASRTPSSSNLRQGVDVAADCSSAAAASVPRLALGPGAGAPAEGLALWRQGERPGALVGIALSIDAAGERIQGVGGPCSAALAAEEQRGYDAASVQAWSGAEGTVYFVAHDSTRGVELGRVTQLSRGTVPAFAAADALWLDEPEARQVSLALAEASGAPALGLAWRVPAGGGWTLRFAELSLTGPDAQFGPQPAPFDVREKVDLLEGPALAYVPDGVRQRAGQGAGWVLVWVEAAAGMQRLMAVRIAAGARTSAEDPFALFEASHIQHAFAYAASESRAGYGFVSGAGAPQLNIGSLECRP